MHWFSIVFKYCMDRLFCLSYLLVWHKAIPLTKSGARTTSSKNINPVFHNSTVWLPHHHSLQMAFLCLSHVYLLHFFLSLLNHPSWLPLWSLASVANTPSWLAVLAQAYHLQIHALPQRQRFLHQKPSRTEPLPYQGHSCHFQPMWL